MRIDRAAVAMMRAALFGTGPATVVPGGLHAFIKSSSEVARADIELLFHTVPRDTRLWWPGMSSYPDGYGITPVLLRPASRGAVTLRSADPGDRPLISYQALSEPDDLAVLKNGVKRALELAQSASLAPFRGAPVDAAADASREDEIENVIRRTAITMLHPSGTCRMGTGAEAVVGADLTVHEVENLRVVDGSVMPAIVSAHPNAAIIMIAEKAAHLIRSSVQGSSR